MKITHDYVFPLFCGFTSILDLPIVTLISGQRKTNNNMTNNHTVSNPIRAGVDIGGTFTDIVLETPNGQTSTKVLTTHTRPEDAIIEGLLAVCTRNGIKPSEISSVIHGTTLATNALIERRGARTALITTEGFRDVIEMRTESRFEQYDLNLVLPEALIPREHRYTVTERILADGNVDTPLDQSQIRTLINQMKTDGIASIAIG